jgi:TPR repeat protein
MKIITAFLLYLLVNNSYCATFEDGENAYKKGNYSKAMSIWLPLAEQGDAKAQYKVGKMYYKGQGQKQNYNEAFIWFKVAAEKNNVEAQAAIGEMYLIGEGVKQDNTEAFKWNKIAAIQGNTMGQNNLGVMYAEGMGVEKNHKEAIKWFELSLKNDTASNGYNNLGWLYENGYGFEKNYLKAAEFYQKAINIGIKAGEEENEITKIRSRLEKIRIKIEQKNYSEHLQLKNSKTISNDPLNIRD